MKRKIFNIGCVILYLCGVIIFSYPDLMHLKNMLDTKAALATVQKKSRHITDSRIESAEDMEQLSEDTTDSQMESVEDMEHMEQLLQAMQEYNLQLFESGQENLTDPWSYQQSGLDLKAYGMDDNIIGVLTVPKMEIELPIYLGASAENMAKGAALMGQTSFPVSGENSNAVLAGHRGWKGIPIFREIERLQTGDTLTIQNFWETLTYQVTDIKILMPDDIEAVLIQPGKNMVTLITCHPYTRNVRRYVVYCEQIEDGAVSSEDSSAAEEQERSEEQEGLEEQRMESEQTRIQGAAEDEEILTREQFWRKAGYGVIILLGILLLKRILRRAD